MHQSFNMPSPIPLYVTYEESFRGLAIRNVITGEWRAKTKAQKAAWQKAYDAVRKQKAAVQEQQDLVNEVENDLQQDINNNVLDVHDKVTHAHFVARVEEVREQYRRLATEHTGVSQRYLDLGKVEQKQNFVVASEKNAKDESEAALERARDAIEQGQERMDLVEGDPPVILDPNGATRMPVAWLTEDRPLLRHRHLVKADVAARTLGVNLGG